MKLDADVLDLLTQNLSRLDEQNEADRAGVYHILSTTSIKKTTAVTPAYI
jgi:hypothetical protein